MEYFTPASPFTNPNKFFYFLKNLKTLNLQSTIIGLLSLLIIIFTPKITKKIPASLFAILVSTILTHIFNLNVLKISDLYVISNSPMRLIQPNFILLKTPAVYSLGITIAILVGVESILACKVSDKLSNDLHHANAELIAQGFGNIASVLLGGIPATAALARTSTNAKNGGKTPIAGIIHAMVLFFILIGLMKYVGMIPIPTIASILIVVSFNMSQINAIKGYIKVGNKKDIAIIFTCLIFTFALNLMVGISVALILWILLNKLP